MKKVLFITAMVIASASCNSSSTESSNPTCDTTCVKDSGANIIDTLKK